MTTVPISTGSICFLSEPVINESHPTAVFVSWLSECNRWKVTRVTSRGDGATPRYFVSRKDAGALAKDGWTVVGHDTTLGAGYPKYYNTMDQAVSVVEQATGRRVRRDAFDLQSQERNDTMSVLTMTPKGKKMRVSRSQAIALLKALNFKGKIEEMDNDRLVKKLKRLPETTLPDLEDESLKNLRDDVLKAVEAGEGVLVKEDEEMTTVVEEKAFAKKGKGRNKVEKGGDVVAKIPKKQGQGRRGVGVIATIVECLCKATSKSPATIESIHKTLVKKFPDRDPKSMLSTVRSQVPSGLRVEKKVEVKRNDAGYWLPREEQAKLPS